MREERLMILRMLSEGKITPEEAQALLDALGEDTADPGSPPAQSAERQAAEAARQAEEAARQADDFSAIGADMARLGDELARLGPEIAESVQRTLDKSLEHLRRQRPLIKKVGVHIDRNQATDTVERRLPMAAGDLLRLQNKLGDINVEFVDGPELVLVARRTAWGSDPDDARRRLAASALELVRAGGVVTVAAEGPRMQFVGFVHLKGTQVGYTLQVPHGVHLDLRTRAGDIRVSGRPAGSWTLDTALGDVALIVGDDPDVQVTAQTRLGDVMVNTGNLVSQNTREFRGRAGNGTASITATTRLGDITIRSR